MALAGSRPFDFEVLDDLAFAAEFGRFDDSRTPGLAVQEIGPVFELAFLAANGVLPPPRAASWLSLGNLDALFRELAGSTQQWVCPDTRRVGFFRTRNVGPEEQSVWTKFGLAAQQAANGAGFAREVAAQLAAVLGELHSNIHEHSEATDTGVLAFQASPGRFELVAADSGIGILESLRSGNEYSALADHGEALRLALSDGVSRFGPGSGRGHGFRPIFVGLANLEGALRFRSGDHALLINGQHPTLMTARQAQKAMLRGFLVSVVCNTGPAHAK